MNYIKPTSTKTLTKQEVILNKIAKKILSYSKGKDTDDGGFASDWDW